MSGLAQAVKLRTGPGTKHDLILNCLPRVDDHGVELTRDVLLEQGVRVTARPYRAWKRKEAQQAIRPVLDMDRWTSTNPISTCQVRGLPEFCERVRDPGECRG